MNFRTKIRTSTGSRRAGAHGAGFTLVELLAVILVISILMTVGVMGIRNLAGGKGTSTAVASVEGLFEEARLIAIGKGTSARVLVDVDDSDNAANYLRRVVIAYRHIDNNGEMTSQWVLANRGYTLPTGVYFSREFSSEDHAGTGNSMSEEGMSYFMVDKDNVARAVSTKKTDWNGDYVFYEFNSEGICQVPGASFIIGSGAMRPGAEKPKVTGSASRDFTGLVIWRNGRTSLFRSPTQMGLPREIKEF